MHYYGVELIAVISVCAYYDEKSNGNLANEQVVIIKVEGDKLQFVLS